MGAAMSSIRSAPLVYEYEGQSVYQMIDGYRAMTTVWVDGTLVEAQIHHDPSWSQVNSIATFMDENPDPIVSYPEPQVIEQEPTRHRSLWSHATLTGLIRITVVRPSWEGVVVHRGTSWFDVTIGEKEPRDFIAMLTSTNPFVLTITKELV